MTTLTESLDRWIVTGSDVTRRRAYACLEAIETQAVDPQDYQRAVRLARRAGLPAVATDDHGKQGQEQNKRPEAADEQAKRLGSNDEAERQAQAAARKQWEASRSGSGSSSDESLSGNEPGRSALSRRTAHNGKPDVFMGQVIQTGGLQPKRVADDKLAFQKQLRKDTTTATTTTTTSSNDKEQPQAREAWQNKDATAKVAELVARAGALSSFDGEKLGIGGLDDVLAEVKRRSEFCVCW